MLNNIKKILAVLLLLLPFIGSSQTFTALKLRQTSYSPYTNLGRTLTWGELDYNFINLGDAVRNLQATAGSGGATNLDALTDVVITTPSTGQLVRFNGTNWVNVVLVSSDIPALDWSKITTGKPTTIAGYGITDAYPLAGNPSNFLNANQSITLSGDITGAGTTVITTTIAPNVVTTGKILDGTITTADLSNSSVTVVKINATGTASSLNFLRGDGSWQPPLSATAPIDLTAGVISIPAAGTFTSGYVNTGVQDFGGVKSFSSSTKMVTIQDFGANDIIDLSVNNIMTVKGATMKVNYLAGTGVRALEADASGIITATGRRNRVLMATVYNPATQHISATDADYGAYTIPAGLMAKDGDAIKLEVTGQLLAPSGVNSLAGYFGATFVFSKTFSAGSTTRSASLFFTVIRTSNTTAVIHVPEPANGQTTINTSNGDLITRTGLNFTTNTYVIKATMGGDGTASGAALGAVRVIFEPAP